MMSNNNRRRNRKSSGNQKQQPQTLLERQNEKSLQLLSSIADMQKSQIHGIEAAVPDVPRIRLRKNRVYTFERSVLAATLTAPTSIDTIGAYAFTLGTLPNYTDFTNLFDQYRIAQVVVTFQPSSPINTASPLYTVIDYDDANALSGINDFLQYDTLEISQSGTWHERVINPVCSIPAYAGATPTGSMLAKAEQWSDVAYYTNSYYGLKFIWPAFTGAQGAYSVLVHYILQFRNSR
jgi:hypothetical protein